MAWARIDDNFFNHPKVRKAGKDAVMFHIAALCYSNAFRTDGFINEDTLELIAMQAFLKRADGYADRLVECKLWWRVEGGYQINDYLEYNKSKTEIEAIAEANRNNGQKGGRPKTKPNQNPIGNRMGYENESEMKASAKRNQTQSEPINPSHINPIKDTTTTPSEFLPFAEVYQSITGSEPLVLNAEIEAVAEIVKAGGTPEDYRRALLEMEDSPYSVTTMASAMNWTLQNLKKAKQPKRANNGHKPKRDALDEILDGAPIFAEDK